MKGDKNQLPDKRFKIYGGGVPWQTNSILIIFFISFLFLMYAHKWRFYGDFGILYNITFFLEVTVI